MQRFSDTRTLQRPGFSRVCISHMQKPSRITPRLCEKRSQHTRSCPSRNVGLHDCKTSGSEMGLIILNSRRGAAKLEHSYPARGHSSRAATFSTSSGTTQTKQKNVRGIGCRASDNFTNILSSCGHQEKTQKISHFRLTIR